MKRVSRVFIGFVVVLLVLGVVGVVLADTLVRQGVERGGGEVTGTEVSLNGASVALLDGGLALDDLVIGNPDGYESEHFIDLGESSVAVNVRSLFDEEMRVSRVHLEGLDIELEQDGGSSNVREILDQAQGLRADDPEADEQDEGAAASEDDAGGQVLVETLTLDDAHVTVRAGVAGEEVAVDLRLDGVELRDVGSETQGSTVTADVLGLVMEAIVVTILEQTADALPEPLDGDFADTLVGMAPETGMSYQHVEGGSVSVEEVRGDSGLIDAIEGAVEEAVDEIEDLL